MKLISSRRLMRIASALLLCWVIGEWFARQPLAARPNADVKAQVRAAYGKLPLRFAANQGQADARVKFMARGARAALALTTDGAYLQLGAQAALQMRLQHANSAAAVYGEEPLAERSHYFLGQDARQWRRDVPHFARVRYADVYPGIDLVFYDREQKLEYDFIVAPGADARRIVLSFAGAQRLRVNAAGDLVFTLAGGEIIQRAPVVYQETAQGRATIPARYRVLKHQRVAFALGRYDRRLPLWIDPVMDYSTFLGGESQDQANAIAVDGEGNVYLAGQTASLSFPGPGPVQAGKGASFDAFVAKINAAGNAVVFATYLGGNNLDNATALALGAEGSVYVTGTTSSTDFPLTLGVAQNRTGGFQDAFVTKLDTNGAVLAYSTYVGGNSTDSAFGIAVDAAGSAVIAGSSFSSELPNTTRRGNWLYQSSDRAANWSASATGLPPGVVSGFAFTPGNANRVYAANGFGLFRSNDGGATWAATGLTVFALSVAVNPTNPDVLYVGTSNGIAKSVDGGATFTTQQLFFQNFTNISFNQIAHIAIDPGDAQTVYLATNGGLAKTTDGGATWAGLGFLPGQGFPTPRFESIGVNRIVIDPNNRQTLYAATQRNLFKSTNGGMTWTGNVLSPVSPFSSVAALALDPVNPPTLYAGTFGFQGGLYKTTDGGVTWQQRNTGLSFNFNGVPNLPNISQLAVDPQTPATVYAASNNGGFFRSTDGGANWSLARNGLSNLIVTGLGVAPNGKLLLGTNPGSDAFVARLNASGSAFTLLHLLGGAESDEARAVALDVAGNIHLFGSTSSFDFPLLNPLQNKNQAVADFIPTADAFVTKLNPSGSALLYSSYLGGNSGDAARALALDAAGNWYLAGTTNSSNFPVTAGAYKTAKAEGDADGFVAKLNAAGTALVFSTFIGGSSTEALTGLVLDSGGQVYVTGQTNSSDYPSVNALQAPGQASNVGTLADIFVSRLSADGKDLLFSSFLGGTNAEISGGIAVDARRNIYLTGNTTSVNFPTLNPLQPAAAQFNSVSDAFLTKLAPQADLAVTSAADHNPVLENGTYTYRATVTNHGPDEALDVMLTDRVPDGVTNVTIASSAGAGVCTGNPAVTCRFGELAPGASVRLTISATAPAATASALTQRATVTSATNDLVTTNNTAALSTRITTAPSIAGRVRLANGAPLPGVTVGIVTAPNPPPPQTTNAQGAYQFAELMRGTNVTVRPVAPGYAFAPAVFTTTNLQRDVTADFLATPCRFGVTANPQNLPMQGGTAQLTITANCPWQARSSVPWITLNRTSGQTGDLITATVAPGNAARSGVITVGDGGSAAAVTLQQDFSACATPNLRIARGLPLTTVGTSLTEGDFNGDGNADLVQFNNQTGVAQVLLGDGRGGFATPAPVALGTITGAPSFSFSPYLLTGDLNGDGRSDLVAASAVTSGSTTTGVFITALADANGTFAAPRSFNLPGPPTRLALARVNNDARLDLLVYANNTLTNWLGGGDGSFTVAGAGQQLFLNDLTTADFNRDNFADLVTISNSELLWHAGDGAGRFAAPVRVLNGNFSGNPVTGDFDRDGHLDIAILVSSFANNQQTNNVAVVTGDGTGRFASTPQRFATDYSGGQLVARDLNNDGWLDLLYRNAVNGLTLMPGGVPPQLLRAPQHFSGGGSSGSFALSDFNRDGLADIAVLTSYANFTDGARNQLALLFGTGIDFIAGRTYAAPQQSGFAVGDFNNDGRSDLVQLAQTTNNLGQAVSIIATRLALGSVQPGTEIMSTLSTLALALEARDFNADGKLDLIVFEAESFSLWAGDGTGRFQFVTRLAAASLSTQSGSRTPVTLAAADFNRDGRDDFITLNTSRQPVLYLSTGASGYAAPQPIGQGQNLTAFYTGDFNGDGAADIVALSALATNCFSGTGAIPLALLLGNGQGGFTNTRATISTAPSVVLTEDLNGDGRTDLVVYNTCTQAALSVEYGTAAGGFTTGAAFTGMRENIARLAIGDVNNDSRKDLVALFGASNFGVSGALLAAFVAKAEGGYNDPVSLGPAELGSALHVADFTGDERNDVLVYSGSYLALYPNNCVTTRTLALSSAASFSNARFAPDSIVAAFGDGLATATEVARTSPLPLQLAGTRITVTDITGTEHQARLYFVSPQQINFQMPPAVATGRAQVTITNSNGVVFSGVYQIAAVAPGLFAANANGQGVAAAVLLRQRKDGIQLYEPVARFDSATNAIVAVPIDFGLESDQLFLLLYGTGLRGRSALSAVTARIGGLEAQVPYAGPQGDLASLDQINVLLPRALQGRGEVEVLLMVDGLAANPVRIQVR